MGEKEQEMYLKRLEMQGFKSFADKTVLEFRPGITAVIGPNGSGKSNISDSIRWVLGEQSMKSLRGAKAEDVIFAGTQNRKSLGFAEASIVIDNSDGKLPIEYNEVTVTRKLYRSGETGYFINKVPCRLKDILELFMDTGIGKDGYSIIGQGKIDEILSNKSEDRRHIFEEAAGIVKYRVRKVESEKKLEQTKLNLLRINDILTEIEGQIGPLKIQAEKAKRFLSLREELKNIEIGLFVYNINTYKERLEQIVADLKVIEEQEIAENKKLETSQNTKENLKNRIDELAIEIENMQNLGFESKTKIEQINSQISVSNERIVNNNNNIERLTNEIEEQKQRIKDFNEEKETKLSKKENLSKNKEKFEAQLKEKEEELAQLSKKLSAKELEIEDKKKKVESNTDVRFERLSEINTYEANYQNLEKTKKSTNEELENSISELDSNRLKKQEATKEFLDIDNKRNKIIKQINEIKSKKEESIAVIKQYDDKINNLTAEYRMKESRYKFLMETEKEKDGYIKSVKSLLLAIDKDANLRTGVEGVLANLISVDKKYEVAIQMCLGQSMQNIVTATENDAKKLIEYLRQNNLGRASFLPISSVHGKKLEKITNKNLNGVIGIASDLIKYDKKYQDIIFNLLGRTVIVENMDTAINLAKQNNYSFRIVTLEGDVINPSGAISGGSVEKKTVNILGRSREIEELKVTLNKIDTEIKNITKEKEEYSDETADIIEQSARVEKELQDIEISYATKKQAVEILDEQIVKLEDKKEKLKKRLEEIDQEQKNIEVSKEGTKQVIENLEKEIAQLNEEITKFAELNKDDQQYIDDLNTDITDLKISVSSFDESGISLDEMITRIEQDIKNANQSIEDKQKEIENIKEETAKTEEAIIDLGKEIDKIKAEVSNSSNKIEELRKEKTDKNEELEAIEKTIEEQFNLLKDIRAQIVKIESRKTKQEQDIDDLINKLWEEYEITPNNAEEYKKPDNVNLAQKRTTELRKEIADLGSINIDAIEDYKKMQERYDFMNSQRYDLEEAIAKLRNVIAEMTTTMQKQFAEKFKQINKNFNEVFVELFGGGKAELILEDESNLLECGIDIRVQPPGKKLQNMMLLSGGEKALTAIAILFAILKINPAPFCVLDEIEAALDDVNVNRYALYLKKFSKDTEFLVITHRKGTMEIADTVYGITMEEKGISKLLSMKLK